MTSYILKIIGGESISLTNDEGDALRLQYLNNVQISKDDIKTASEFVQMLLDRIFDDMSAVSS